MKKTLLFALALQLVNPFALAETAITEENTKDSEPKWYQADLLVFRYLDTSSTEAWPEVNRHPVPVAAKPLLPVITNTEDPLTSDLLGSVDTSSVSITADIAREAFINLPPEEFVLDKAANTLSRSSDYRVIAQMAWRLPIDDNIADQPVAINVSGGGENPHLLSGTVTISASRFLHVDVDLWWNELSPEDLFTEMTSEGFEPLSVGDAFTDIATQSKSSGAMIYLDRKSTPLRITRNFQLKEKRRIKNSSEIQYLDSPVIGVLFKLTPYDRPKTMLEVSAR